MTSSLDGKTLWSGDERGDLKARERGDLKARSVRNGALQSTLRLLSPDAAAPHWVRRTRAEKVESSP